VSDEFYVGYLDAPPEAARRLRRIAAGLVGAAAVVAVALALATGPFDEARFEYDRVSSWSGTIEARPVPVLIAPAGERFPLVLPGKHGASPVLAAFDGAAVALRGKRIVREGTTMLEVDPSSIVRSGEGAPAAVEIDLGPATFEGEIVDSKCFLGVMNPGRLEVHRACARRCIAGGIPPMLFTHDAGGRELRLILVGGDGEPINDRVLDVVATPVTVRGRLGRRGDLHYLYVAGISNQR